MVPPDLGTFRGFEEDIRGVTWRAACPSLRTADRWFPVPRELRRALGRFHVEHSSTIGRGRSWLGRTLPDRRPAPWLLGSMGGEQTCRIMMSACCADVGGVSPCRPPSRPRPQVSPTLGNCRGFVFEANAPVRSRSQSPVLRAPRSCALRSRNRALPRSRAPVVRRLRSTGPPRCCVSAVPRFRGPAVPLSMDRLSCRPDGRRPILWCGRPSCFRGSAFGPGALPALAVRPSFRPSVAPPSGPSSPRAVALSCRGLKRTRLSDSRRRGGHAVRSLEVSGPAPVGVAI
jgi:hypothetical protein